jgi:hypothetical protein
MSEAVQAPVQQRDAAVRDESGLKAWAPRTDGKRAVLVTPRATVFDHVVAPPAAVPEVASDPIWDHKGGTAWTPDFVHCRLLVVGEIMARLPPVLRKGYVSQLGTIAISELAADRRIPPTPAEISMADWTLFEIASRRWAQILLASAFGISAEKIAQALKAKGESVSNRTVQRRYIGDRRVLAGRWQAMKMPLDRGTIERWIQIFDPAEK